MKKVPRKLVVLAVVAGACALPAAAQAPATHTVRFGIGAFLPTGDVNISIDTGDVDVTNRNEFKSAFGLGASYEYRWSDLIGIDAGVRFFRPDVAESTRTGNLSEEKAGFLPLTVGPMFHFGEVGRFRFYAGPQLVWVLYTDPDLAPDVDIDYNFDDELTWGLKGGVDYQFDRSPWILSGTVEYIDASADVDGGVKLRPNPIVVTVGAGYRF